MRLTNPAIPEGALDLLILKVVMLGPVHGYVIAQRLDQVSRGAVQVPQGSLYPALHRLENRGFLAADWKATETGREAKFYRLTRKGWARLETEAMGLKWLIETVGLILKMPPGGAKRVPGILRSLMFLLWLVMGANVQAQSSRESSSVSYLERGNEWMAKGEWDRAIADYDLAIAFNSQAAIAYYNRGLARRRKGDLAGARRDLDRTIELTLGDAKVYLIRGVISHEVGEVDAAIRDFSRAIELDPRNAQAWNNRGNVRGERGDLAGAIADFDQAIKLDPRNAVVWGNRCGIHYLRRALESAIADCDRAIKLDANNADAWNSRGLAKQKKGDLGGSLTDFDRAVALAPQQAGFYSNRGSRRSPISTRR
jgi:transcriptional regulator